MSDWIEYDGSGNHPNGPVLVEVRTRDGMRRFPDAAHIWTWGRSGDADVIWLPEANEIVAYRYVATAEVQALGDLKESDPSGISQHTSGAKLDAGKPRAALVLGGFARALMEVIKVGTAGAAKYTDNGWQEVENGAERYADASLRHFLKRAMGKDIDPDFDLDHAAHEAWNSLAKLELILREKAKNDI